MEVETTLGKRKGYKEQNGLYVEIYNNAFVDAERIYAVGDLKGETPFVISKGDVWGMEHRAELDAALDEFNSVLRQAREKIPQELTDEIKRNRDIMDSTNRVLPIRNTSDNDRFQVIGEKGAKALDKAQEATTRLDNLSVARDMEKELSKSFAEKKELIEKLRNAKTIDDKYQGQYELNRESVKNWAKNNLRGEYKNEDTNETFLLNRIGENKVTSHSMGSDAHLKSIAAIPEMLRDAIFIEEMPNTKNNDKFDSYRYYVCGIKIDNVDYTAKITIGVKQGKKYYDHSLTDIQKGKLLDLLQDQAVKQSNFTTMGNASVPSYERLSKDNKLISILQTSDKEIAKRIKFATGWERGADGKWRYEIQDFDVKLDGSADKIRQEKKQSWYKELNELEDKIFDEKATDEEEKRFDELSELKDEWEKSRVDTDRKFLPDYIVDDELLNAYPQLKRVEVVTINNPKAPYDGMFDKDRNTIFVNEAKTNTPLRETLAHEVQHAIQHEEGFAQGGNENTYKHQLKSLKEKRDAWSLVDSFKDKKKELGDDASEIDVYNAVKKDYADVGMQIGVYKGAPSEDSFNEGFNLWVRGYSKSKRAVEAEKNGLRNSSQMNKDKY